MLESWSFGLISITSFVWDVHSQSPTAAKLKSSIRDYDNDAYAKFYCCCCCCFCSPIVIVVVIEMANKITIDSSKQTNTVKNLTDNVLSGSFVN
jgi:hypothetical protein